MHQPVEVVRPRLRHVSTEDQTPLPQSQALKSAGCVEIHEEQASGGNRARPVLARVLERIGKGDMDKGHSELDRFVKGMRTRLVQTLRGLPGPKRD